MREGTRLRIAVDAMGSDKHPEPEVQGAALACERWPNDRIVLVGDRQKIQAVFARMSRPPSNLHVVHADSVMGMTELPSDVLKRVPDTSVHVGLRLLKEGQVDAFVSAGNTGGLLALATLGGSLGRLQGVIRPAVAPLIPWPAGHFLILDVGANADCRPEFLVQFASMGSVYCQKALGLDRPRVALLSNGEESGKGNQLVRQSAKRLDATDLHFVGNVEPKDVLAGAADVVVTDGFTGNIFIKTLEAVLRHSGQRGAEAVGGALLLGLDHIVIAAHGRSSEVLICQAIHQARAAVEAQVISCFVAAVDAA